MKINIFKILILFLFFPISASYAFKPTAEFGHVGIVRDALQDISRTSSDGNSTFKFSEKAILAIRDSTAGVDEIISDRGELSVPTAHCDDELLPECSQRLIDIKNTVIGFLTNASPDGENARREVGRALHTLQDFYSHSNWIELGNTNSNDALGISQIPRLNADDQTCETGFSTLGGGTLANFGLTDLTTGYFSLVSAQPEGKCNHGLGLAPGIHKDAPGRDGHDAARQAAVLGTEDFINQILDAPGIQGNDKAIRAFMDVQPSLGFAIDDTGSMGGIISGVKNQVSQIVDLAVANPDQAPDNYVLVRFGDPDVGSAYVTDQPESFKSAVNALSANGGGDCPELSMTGLLNAVEASSSGSNVYLFTDATAKDSSLFSNVVAAANAKDISIHAYLFGSCSPIDPAYYAITSESGGQLFFSDGTTEETEKLFDLIKPSVTDNLQPIIIANGDISGTEEYSVPVDSTVTKLTVSVSMETKGTIQLFDPSDNEILVNITDTTGGRIFTVTNPEVGQWTVKINGTGKYNVLASGSSDIEFYRFNFVELRGRPEHEGLFPIKGEPLAGIEYTALANVSKEASSVFFELRSDNGQLIDTVNLSQGAHEEASIDDFSGSFVLPNTPFRVYIRAKDDQDKEVLRAFPPMFTAQSVKITPIQDDGINTLIAGGNIKRFEVKNLGASGSFNLTATDTHGFVTDYLSEPFMLDNNESKIIEVNIFVPEQTLNNTIVQLTLSVIGNSRNSLISPYIVSSGSSLCRDLNQCTILGTSNNDIINGTDGDDVICGLEGDDIIYGLGGNDTICGFSGNDEIYGGEGNDLISGDIGDDIIDAGSGEDKVYGGSGDDEINGGSGSDNIEGGDGNDTIEGGSGNDIIKGQDGNDLISGNSGNDDIDGGIGIDTINGNTGKDVCQDSSDTNMTKCEIINNDI